MTADELSFFLEAFADANGGYYGGMPLGKARALYDGRRLQVVEHPDGDGYRQRKRRRDHVRS
jgi:hypothetical protein